MKLIVKSPMKIAWIYMLSLLVIQIIVSSFGLLSGCKSLDCNFLTKYLMLSPSNPESYFGIISMHFIHGSWQHFMGNVSSLLFISILMSYSFERIRYVSLYLSFMVFIGLFVIAFSPAPVIGASGIVYALYGYSITRGYLSNKKLLVVIASFLFFMKGQAFFLGMVPSGNTFSRVSWEAHLAGGLIGFIVGLFDSDYISVRIRSFVEFLNKKYLDDK